MKSYLILCCLSLTLGLLLNPILNLIDEGEIAMTPEEREIKLSEAKAKYGKPFASEVPLQRTHARFIDTHADVEVREYCEPASAHLEIEKQSKIKNFIKTIFR